MNAAMTQPEIGHKTDLRTPNYVLLLDKRKIGPSIVDNGAQSIDLVIYGFADEIGYRQFMASSQQLLMPYPLVKTYLRDQLAEVSTGSKLVVVDAAGTQELQLRAVTMQAVLSAMEEKTTHMTATHDLEFVQASNAYRVK